MTPPCILYRVSAVMLSGALADGVRRVLKMKKKKFPRSHRRKRTRNKFVRWPEIHNIYYNTQRPNVLRLDIVCNVCIVFFRYVLFFVIFFLIKLQCGGERDTTAVAIYNNIPTHHEKLVSVTNTDLKFRWYIVAAPLVRLYYIIHYYYYFNELAVLRVQSGRRWKENGISRARVYTENIILCRLQMTRRIKIYIKNKDIYILYIIYVHSLVCTLHCLYQPRTNGAISLYISGVLL